MFLLAIAAAASLGQGRAESPSRIDDDFQRGLCVAPCPGADWAFAQTVEGDLAAVTSGRGDAALRARVGPREGRVPKAAIVARPAKAYPGDSIRVRFDLLVPEGAPLNSIHLADIECASCGVGGNPGVRLYLRNGRLRIDRSKIGIRDAWTKDDAPQLRHGRWHGIELDVLLGEEGRATVRLDGRTVLEGRGATTVLPEGLGEAGADRIQIGITANSNPQPAIAYFDNVRVEVDR